jgi:hypothetical protein
MTGSKFSEQDKEKFIEYLNAVAKYAKFSLNTDEVIKYYKLLSYMQQTLLPKINDNILEIRKVTHSEQSKEVDSSQ